MDDTNAKNPHLEISEIMCAKCGRRETIEVSFNAIPIAAWRCDRCRATSSVASCKSEHGDTNATRLAMQMQFIEQEQAIRLRRLERESELEKLRIKQEQTVEQKLLEERETLERRFLKERFEMLSMNIPNDRESVHSRGSHRHSVEKVNDWIEQSRRQLVGNQVDPEIVARPTKGTTNEVRTIPSNGTTSHISAPQPFPYDSSGSQADTRSVSTLSSTRSVGRRSLDAPHIDLAPDTERRSFKAPRDPSKGPSQQQIAARHVMPRDLPTFSGNPEEWPLFISQYNNTTLACGYSNAENLVRLQRCLKGHALESMRCSLLVPDTVPQVIDDLRMLYGRPALLVEMLLRKVRSIPAPRSDKLEMLIDFGMAVNNLCRHLEAIEQKSHLTNPMLLQELEDKLPADIRLQWALRKGTMSGADLLHLNDFLMTLVRAASQVAHRTVALNERQKGKDKTFVHAHLESEQPVHSNVVLAPNVPKTQKNCPVCKMAEHAVKECPEFKSSEVEQRWKIVHTLKLCRSCLNGHGKKPCRFSTQCGQDGCQYRHHILLHSAPRTPNQASHPTSHGRRPIAGPSTSESHTHRSKESALLFKVLPVTLHGKNGVVETFAFLDDGSDSTLIESTLANKLGITGLVRPLTLKWTNNVTRQENESQVVQVSISGRNKARRYVMNARTVSKLQLPKQTLHFQGLAAKYLHLRGLPVTSYEAATPQIIIGLNNLHISMPLKFREGGERHPVAIKTRLGWSVYGGEGEEDVNHTFHMHEKELHEVVREYICQEDLGVKAITVESEEEKRAYSILESTTIRVGDRFETGLLWKQDYFEFPDSYYMALKRLQCLERRMAREPTLKENLHRQIREYQDKQYAHRASEAELQNADPRRIWYLPIGAVVNPKKPHKVRLIWDAAAKVESVSLNSMLMKGPDLLVSLAAVLFRFREGSIAVSADVKEMFHQVQIRTADRHSQRFLWRENPSKPPEIYLMNVATFGATCSSCSAQYIKNKNAQEFNEKFPKAAEAVLKGHYVDDYVDSFNTIEEAREIALQVKWIQSKAGFDLRNWLSNSPELNAVLGGSTNAMIKDLMLGGGETSERVLGMLWSPENDSLGFSAKMRADVQLLIDENKRPTKRQVLRCVMTIYDPLGLLTSILVHGKVLIQQIWRSGVGWDDWIDDVAFERWLQWIEMIPKVNQIRVPRCYHGIRSHLYTDIQLHVFVDASEAAYACAAYFRYPIDDGTANTVLVTAKSKVAPLRPISIPRLELNAAVLGARVAKFVKENHRVEISKTIFWSDSTTVLAWINSDPKKYRQYIAHRVGEILSLSDVGQWRWVPSKMNVADEATKWGKGPYFDGNSRWFKGPSLLDDQETEWPQQFVNPLCTDEEIRSCFTHHTIQNRSQLLDYNRFSKWTTMLRTMAYVLRYVSILKEKRTELEICVGRLTQEELQNAERAIWKAVQWECYKDEILALEKGFQSPDMPAQTIDKGSSIYTYSPTVDELGVLRMDSRAKSAPNIPSEAKFPVILPKNHRVTELILNDYHYKYHHANPETITNEVRQRFVIPFLRVAVRRMSRNCQLCRIKRAQPAAPRMAPLPAARLASFVRPFSYVGLDYFGPILVRQGRCEVKRWIALFTCLTIRAVHVEVVHNLTTEACIKSVRRFVCRRGAPLEIYSDNATNFMGAEIILRDQVSKINIELADTFTSTSTKWLFIPPASPHMGGCWERMVRSIKTAMSQISTHRRLDDEGLLTLVIEAEAIVNSRPLTYMPLDTPEQESLTPNHFLLGSSSGAKQPIAELTTTAAALKGGWNQIRHQLDTFWRRWTKEYLPTITRRTKWFEEVKPVAVGDLVLIADDPKRNNWIRGRVTRTITAKDGRVRQAVVSTSKGEFRRPVVKLDVNDVGKTAKHTQSYGGRDVTANATGNPTSIDHAAGE
ncbi:uncharacterized protein LOC131681103 [Topomyia yanbarensis]|uniref:uncharacterized protein LOC131681103 n=1 Tax=Topomyia yanbarensis TaxID=2498891 RepID=UPI00273BEC29|nr:uncharacterized protein LOC131681103 [Topomyia yanbarensis]